MTYSRAPLYIIYFVLGIIFWAGIFFDVDCTSVFRIGLIVTIAGYLKDAYDEYLIGKKRKSPLVFKYCEHSPFLLVTAWMLWNCGFCLLALFCFIDVVWDISQDIRA